MLAVTLAFLIAIGITPLTIKLYRSKNWLDDPRQKPHIKQVHSTATPRGGGLALYLAIVIPSLLFLKIDKYLISIIIGSTIIAVIGWLDDIYDLNPFIRLLSNLVVAIIIVGTGIGIAYISHPFNDGVIHLSQPQLHFELWGQDHSIWILSSIFAILFIIWNMNSINWSTGLDGQMPGFTAIAAFFIGLLSMRFIDDPTQFNTTMLCFIVASAYFGYLFWNWYPQKSMPGYGGSSLAGFFLSVLAILSGAKLATMLMVLALPTADAVFTFVRRIIAKKSPFWGDRGHFHHKLIDVLGWSKPKIAIFYWTCSLTLGILSLYLNTWQKSVTIIIVFIMVFSFLIWAKIQAENK